jgi:putative nucleotidyltransferase with HDIG domain
MPTSASSRAVRAISRMPSSDLSLLLQVSLQLAASLALETRDDETQGHALRVAGLAVELGRAVGIGGEDLPHLRRGALLHDIGKMVVPDAILRKPGPLTAGEWAVMRRHPESGRDFLRKVA